MMQAPMPQDFVPIFGMMTGVLVTGMFLLGPVGRAIGEVIRHWLGGGRKADAALPSAEIDELHSRLDQVQHQLAELAERQDFAERLLARARDKGALGPGDGA
jgi:hypothetical protein